MPMDIAERSDTNVIVVGAGPTGLLLAGDLAAAGIRTTLIEKRTHRSELSRACVVHARTLEQLDQRGLAEELIERGNPVTSLRLFDKAVIDLATLPSRYPFMLVVPQTATEDVLLRRAEAVGVEFIRSARLSELLQDSMGVTAELASGRRIRAAYLVGADGYDSTVRRLVKQPFPGRTTVRSVLVADVLLAGRLPELVAANSIGDRFACIAPFGDGRYRVIAWDRSNQREEFDPESLDGLKEITASVLGTDFGMHSPRWFSRLDSDERQVPRYRVGRVFLAGDAAHVHSPAGGQGMNTGMQDAANLSWKLAMALTGGLDLLSTYHGERHPIGLKTIKGSGTLLRMATLQSNAARTARNEIVSAALHVPNVGRKLPAAISGLWVKYPAPRGAHPLTGTRADDASLRGAPTRLYEMLRAGMFVLVDCGGQYDREAAYAEAAGRLRVALGADPDAPSLLIRPDGYVAWAADAAFPDPKGLTRALATWVAVPKAR